MIQKSQNFDSSILSSGLSKKLAIAKQSLDIGLDYSNYGEEPIIYSRKLHS